MILLITILNISRNKETIRKTLTYVEKAEPVNKK